MHDAQSGGEEGRASTGQRFGFLHNAKDRCHDLYGEKLPTFMIH